MKFQVYCDETVQQVSPVETKLSALAKVERKQFSQLSRRELQALAKENGIKANVKSSQIVELLMSKSSKSVLKKQPLQNIENVDPRKRMNKKKPKSKKTKSKVVATKNKITEQRARRAIERDNMKRLAGLVAQKAAEEACQREPEAVAISIAALEAKREIKKQPSQEKLAEIVHEVAVSTVEQVMKNVVISVESKLHKEAVNAAVERTHAHLHRVKLELQKQEQLVQELEATRKLRSDSLALPVATPVHLGRFDKKSLSLSKDVLMREKENITPGCQLPVSGSSMYFSGRQKRFGRKVTPLALRLNTSS